ncbi:MAG: amino acid adenylation domain-containing protein, partial [Cyanobacteria bacterium P01_H01_bin.121]
PVDLSDLRTALDRQQSSQDFALTQVELAEWTSLPLTVLVSVGEQLSITAKYNGESNHADLQAAQADADAILSNLLTHLRSLLLGLLHYADRPLVEVPMLSEAELQQLTDWNQTTTDYDLDLLLPDRLTQQVQKTPEALAVLSTDLEGTTQNLTYETLHDRAEKLAQTLQTCGVCPETPVAVCLERSPNLIIALLAILKAGGTYVPLDPSYPRERLQWMLEDSGSVVLLSDRAGHEALGMVPAGLHHLDLTQDSVASAPLPGKREWRDSKTPCNPNSSIYIIYTSGSTGKPKGVINTQRGLLNRLLWMQDTYGLSVGDRVLHKTSISFDVSVWELLWPLLTGATLVLCPPGLQGDSAGLVKLIQQQQVDTLHFVPAMLAAFLEVPNVSDCHSLKRVICSGEALPTSLQQRFFEQLPKAELHNLYGPTEAAIDVTAWQATSDPTDLTTVSIGYPIANTEIHILDTHQRPVPVGMSGELHIGGVNLARGYLNRPELTAERFVTSPYAAGRLYKTGDRARYLPNGAIEFLGRIDHQVKLRGFRIETGEIESVLTQHPQVHQAVVSLQETAPGHPQLVAYVVLRNSEHGTETMPIPDLEQHLQRFLPDYMRPRQWVILPELPLHPNGKVNRRALPTPEAAASGVEKVAPRNATEQQIAAIWTKVLPLPASYELSIHDNFFMAGGNSLLATRINVRLQQTFALELPLRTLFECPTIAELAVRIEALQMTVAPPEVAESSGQKEISL